MQHIRDASLEEAERLGYPVNTSLPLLEVPNNPKGLLDITRRLLTLYAVVACSYGLSKEKAKSWLEREELLDELSGLERIYLGNTPSVLSDPEAQWQVEALWALAWAVGAHDSLDFSDSCANDFIQMLPDIKSGASTAEFRNRLKLRHIAEILNKCDLSYCLHWAIREAEINAASIPGSVPAQVVVERRRALEWILGGESWDDISLDT